MHEQLIFEHSARRPQRRRRSTRSTPRAAARPREPAPRAAPPLLPEVSELQAVRHFTRLSQLNFSIDTHFYPLGSCTMKYNPRACNQYAMLPEFLGRHPLAPESHGAGLPAVPVRAAGDAEGSDRHARRLADADGGRAGRVRRRRDDPRLPRGAQRPRAHRDHRAGCRARHEPGDGDDVRLHGARDPVAAERRHRPRRAAAPRSARRRPASCSPTRRRSACSSGASARSPRSCTRRAACSTTTAPT